MGVYDMYQNVQLKVGPCDLSFFQEGDKVPIPDGIYVGFEGIVLILDGTFTKFFEHVTDKWGSAIYPGEIIEKRNPVFKALQEKRNGGKKRH